MKVAAICATYLRPVELASAIEGFLRQDYPADRREMIVLDDADQYAPHALDGIPGVRLVVSPVRFRTLGEKRNATAALVSADVDAYCVWDDDDIYLPWHISAAVAGLKDAEYTIPATIWVDGPSGFERKQTKRLFHGSWAFRRELFDRVAGYPFMQSGQDQALRKRFEAIDAVCGDPCQHEPRPSYIYRWFRRRGCYHLSAMGEEGYERLGVRPAVPIEKVEPAWEKDWAEGAA